MKLIFTSDHAGIGLRKHLVSWANAQGHTVLEVGAPSTEAYDYPDAAEDAVPAVANGEVDFGVFICGSGIGISIQANRHLSIRAANCVTIQMAALARQHNHANVLCLGERLVSTELAEEILRTFLETDEDRADRHQRRVNKLGERHEMC